jgi:ubiquinone/menaquinone biosynthesis C-methylase UbiE
LISEVKKYYDAKAPTYDAQSELFYFHVYDTVTWRYTEPYVPTNPEALVLDAAGGTGKWTIPIAKCGPKVVLVDGSNGMLEVARKKIRQQSLQGRVRVQKGDIRRLDFPDETFDMVFCDHALCFIKEQKETIKELVRVLKPNHPLIISGQNRYVLSLSLMQNIDFATRVLSNETQFLMGDRLKVYALSPDEFKHLLEENAVEIEKIIGKGVTMPLIFPLQKPYPKDNVPEFLEKLLKIEFALCEKPDALALAGHLQAIGYKKTID